MVSDTFTGIKCSSVAGPGYSLVIINPQGNLIHYTVWTIFNRNRLPYIFPNCSTFLNQLSCHFLYQHILVATFFRVKKYATLGEAYLYLFIFIFITPLLLGNVRLPYGKIM